MDTRRKWGVWLIALSGALLVLLGLEARYAGHPNAAFTSSASALAIIAGVSVGIERVLEGFWTASGQMIGWWWPLSAIGEQVKKTTADLDEAIRPLTDDAIKTIGGLPDSKDAIAKLKDVSRSIQALPDRITAEQLALLPASAKDAVQSILDVCKDKEGFEHLTDKAETALDALAQVKTFADSFKDNPGKRIISIYAGMLLGLAVAWILGLDLFQATLALQAAGAAGRSSPEATALFPAWSIAVTGLIIGLGSGPTHEAIKLLTEWKRALKP